MNSLKDRLNRLKKSSDNAPAAPEIPQLRDWEKLGATLCENDWGQFIVRRRVYPFDYAHGSYRLGELCGEAEALESLLTLPQRSGGATVRHDRLLFLDTETTGLGIGAGNVPFMIGIGYYEPDRFIVEQMFIRNPAEEAAMLHHLREKLMERDMLVTYNGKCFDWPIIKNRYILNRRHDVGTDPVHFDFLFPSRSLWRNTLPSCRLGSVERERLGLSRTDDVPGSLAPALYFQYLAEGDPSIVAGVFEHNEKDIMTLACLAAHFTRLLQMRVPHERLETEELFRLALWLEKSGRRDYAGEAMRSLIARDAEESADYWLPAASFFKKRGQLDSAVFLWERYIERKKHSRLVSAEPYIELAMYCEHQLKDAAKALRYAEQAMERIWGRLPSSRKEGNGKGAEEGEAVRKRIERLQKKIAAAEQRSGTAGTDQSGMNARTHPFYRPRRRKPGNDSVWQQTLL